MIDRLPLTIVAISSAPATGAVGIVRLAGTQAHAIARAVLAEPYNLADIPSSTRTPIRLRLEEHHPTLPGWMLFFRAPHSYTGDDLIEFYLPGSLPLLDLLIERCVQLGAVRAIPGEFTARAFLAGKIDLTQAEGIAALIRSGSEAQHRAARRLLARAISTPLQNMAASLAQVTALVEAGIDFAEEPIEFITIPEIQARLAEHLAELAPLLTRHTQQSPPREPPRVLLFGHANAGKSTLINRLSGLNRMICAAVAGTTRDLVTVPATIGGIPCLLVDSAGMHATTTPLLLQAQQYARDELQRADLVCVVLDASQCHSPSDLAQWLPAPDHNTRLLANKSDLGIDPTLTAALTALGHPAPLFISALTGEGIPALIERIKTALASTAASAGEEARSLSHQQSEALEATTDALRRALDLVGHATAVTECADLIAFELREAMDHLSIITGGVTTEEMLGSIFSQFCIGK